MGIKGMQQSTTIINKKKIRHMNTDINNDFEEDDGLNEKERFLKGVVEGIKGLRKSEDHLTYVHRKEIADMLEEQIREHPEVYSRLSDFRIPIEHKLKEMGGIVRTKNTIYKLTYKLINEFDSLRDAYTSFKDLRKTKSRSGMGKNAEKICSKCKSCFTNGSQMLQGVEDEEFWREAGVARAPAYKKVVPNAEPTKREKVIAKEVEKGLYQVFDKPNYESIMDKQLQ